MWIRKRPVASTQLFFRAIFTFVCLLMVAVPIQAQEWKTAMMVPGAQVLASGTVNFTKCFTARNSGSDAWYTCSDSHQRRALRWNTVWPHVHRDISFRLNEPGQVYVIFTARVGKTWAYEGGSAAISKLDKDGSWHNVWLGPGLRSALFRGSRLVDTGPYANQPGPPPLRYRIGKDGKIQFREGIPRYEKGQYRLTLTEAMFHNTNTADKTYHPCRLEYKLVFVPDNPIPSAESAIPAHPVQMAGTTHGQVTNTWTVNKAGNIYRLNDKLGWTHVPGKKAKDVGVGANGSVWIVGTSPVYGGFAIYRWNKKRFVRVDGGAVRIDVDRDGMPWVVNKMNDIYRRVNNHWKRMPGKAVDIGIGANGSVWVIGIGRTPGGHGIWQWNGSNWERVQGAAVRVDVDAAGNPWVVNDAGGIFKWNGKGWNTLPGLGTDITVGGGSEWVIGTDSVPGGHGIYKWRSRTRKWKRVPGGAVAISTGGVSNGFQSGTPVLKPTTPPGTGPVFSKVPYTWAVNRTGRIYRLNKNRKWKLISGVLAKDIGVGANGTVWIIGTKATRGGYAIYRWMENRFARVDGAAVRIDVGPWGTPWVVNSFGNIYRWVNKRWEHLPGKAVDIGVGADGSAWVLGTSHTRGGYGIFRFNGNNWDKIKGGAVRIDVDDSGNPWIVNDAGKIFRWNRNGWNVLPGLATDISAGGSMVVVTGTDTTVGGHGIYQWVEKTRKWKRLPGGAVAISTGQIPLDLSGNAPGAPAPVVVQAARYKLKSGRYKVKTWVGGTLYESVWTLRVRNGKITGMSSWPCCPGPRTDALKGHITGNRILIKRDCSGQGWNGGCIQTYTGKVKGNRIEGTAAGTGLTGHKTTWTLLLGSRTALNFRKR